MWEAMGLKIVSWADHIFWISVLWNAQINCRPVDVFFRKNFYLPSVAFHNQQLFVPETYPEDREMAKKLNVANLYFLLSRKFFGLLGRSLTLVWADLVQYISCYGEFKTALPAKAFKSRFRQRFWPPKSAPKSNLTPMSHIQLFP